LSDFNKLVLKYRYRKDEVENGDRISEGLSAFSIRFTRDLRDKPYYPESGYRFLLDGEFSGGILGADVSYSKAVVDLSWYLPLWWKFVLASHYRSGVITDLKCRDEMKEYYLFFVGGALTNNILRGYKEKTLPSDGANLFSVLNIELRFPLIDPVFGYVFFDTGGGWMVEEGIQDVRLYDLKLRHGAGAGLQLQTPFGVFRIGYGWPLWDKEKRHGEFYFSMAPGF
jgi:outer membrane protein insertion porin family